MDRFGSRRVWENSQRGCLILRHPKSYLPTHSVIHKSAIRVLAIFADASRTGYAEAKWQHKSGNKWSHDASRTGYAEAKVYALKSCSNCFDASRTGYAEAKWLLTDNANNIGTDASRTGYAEAKVAAACLRPAAT